MEYFNIGTFSKFRKIEDCITILNLKTILNFFLIRKTKVNWKSFPVYVSKRKHEILFESSPSKMEVKQYLTRT